MNHKTDTMIKDREKARRKITYKDYYCPTCKTESKHNTNHTGEIYVRCKNCGANILYCKNSSLGIPESTVKIIYYRINTDTKEGKSQYKLLQYKLKSWNYKIFNVIAESSYMKEIKKHNNQTINLYKINQFNNQFISDIGRIFYWYETVYPNKNIHEGYYITIE